MTDTNSLNDVKIGALLSYAFVLTNTIFGLFITPYILYSIGELEYGVYKSVASLASSLSILDLGIGAMLTRYIARYKADKQEDRIDNFVSMALGEDLILISIVSIVCFVVLLLIPKIYSTGLNSNQIVIAKKIFLVLSFNLCLNILFHLICGIIQGNNKYSVSNAIQLFKVIIKIISLICILKFLPKAIVISIIDLILTICAIIVGLLYVRYILKIQITPKFRNWERKVFWESFKYTGLLFLTSIAAQVNNNLDNVVIGAQLGAAKVAVYSIGLSIFGMFESLSTAISGVMLPTITNALTKDKTRKSTINLIISAGRIQFLLLGSAFAGFIVLGKKFIRLWIGTGFEDVYIIVLILMGPALLELCVNVCLAILRAENKLGFRTLILTISTIINAIITIIGVHYWGYIAAAIGTAISFFFGSVVVMSIYYYKQFKINMIYIYKSIFGLIWLCILISAFVTKIVSSILNVNWLTFILSVSIYLIIFSISMFSFGLSKEEIYSITSIVLKRRKQK